MENMIGKRRGKSFFVVSLFYFFQNFGNFFEVFDEGSAQAAVVEGGCRMIEDEKYLRPDTRQRPAESLAVDQGNFLAWNEMFHSMPPERHDDFRPDDFYLFIEPGQACADFFRERIAVIRWAIFHDVGDVNVFPLELDSSKHLRKEFSCRADEGDALEILIFPRRFADEENFCQSASVPWHGLGCLDTQRTIALERHSFIQGIEGFLFIHILNFRIIVCSFLLELRSPSIHPGFRRACHGSQSLRRACGLPRRTALR